MTQPQTPTREELLDALKQSRDNALASLRALPPATFEDGRYENSWNGRQILAHMASIEWMYPRLLQLASSEPGATPSQPAAATSRGGIDDYNQRMVEKRAEASVSELLDEFERNRAATIAAVEAAEPALLGRPIRSAGGVEGTLGSVLMAVAVRHIEQHTRDILGEN